MKVKFFEMEGLDDTPSGRKEFEAQVNAWLAEQTPGSVQSITPITVGPSKSFCFVAVCHGKAE